MLHVTVDNSPRGLRLSIGPRPAGSPLRSWRGNEAARILDRSLPGWRNLGGFELTGGEPVRRILLAATAEDLAREGEAGSEGDGHEARQRFAIGRGPAGERLARYRATPGGVALPAGSW